MSETNKPKSMIYKGKYTIFDKELPKVLINDFRNTPLQPFILKIWSFFYIYFHTRMLSFPAHYTRDTLANDISVALEYAMFLKHLREGKIKASGWQFTRKGVVVYIYDCIEKEFIEHLDHVCDIFFDCPGMNEEKNITVDAWENMFRDFPCSETIEFEDKIYYERDDDEDEDVEPELKHQRLSRRELNGLIDDLKYYRGLVDGMKLDDDRPFIHRLIEFLLDAGMPKSRPVYDQLYRALDYWGLIPDDVKQRHECGEPYNDSNYIKSYVSTIAKHKKQQKKYYDGL